MKSLQGKQLEQAHHMLADLVSDPRLEFVATNDERDFVANCQKCRHIHWPELWLERLGEIHEKVCE